jgi:hypothetical protein
MSAWILAIVWYFPRADLNENRPMPTEAACLAELTRLRETYQSSSFSAGCLRAADAPPTPTGPPKPPAGGSERRMDGAPRRPAP